MKKKSLYIGLFIGSILLSACSDMLDQVSPDQPSTTDFWKNTKAAEAGLSAAYSQIECKYDSYEFSEVKFTVEPYREDMIIPGADAYNYDQWIQLYDFTYNNSNTQFSLYWGSNYKGINYANQVIENVPNIEDIDAEYAKQIVAESKFLRAYYHMKLLLNWEEIIVKDKPTMKESDVHKGLSPRVEAWDFIMQDLKDAAPYLPTKAGQKADQIGRATQGSAYTCLGYIALTRAYEESAKKADFLNEAVQAFAKVTGYELEKDFLSMFDGTNENSKESILEVQFSENTSSGAFYKNYIHRFVATPELRGWDEIRPTAKMLEEMKKEGKVASTGGYDTRLYKSIFFNDEYFNDPETEMVYGTPFKEKFKNDPEKMCFRKYLPRDESRLSIGSGGTNIVVWRYADVLLLTAEALNEQGKPNEAIPYINRVRARADMPAKPTDISYTQDQIRTIIEHERIMEFALENTRFYDLRRWGKTKEALHAAGRKNFDPAKHNFYPVPMMEIVGNDTLK